VIISGNLAKNEVFEFFENGVGRGVLQFWGVWYREPRSNFVGFWVFGADPGN